MHMTDWMPTLYSAAGGKIEDLGEIDGVDQWETLKNGKPSPRKNMLVNIDEMRGWESAIMGEYKLIKGDIDNLKLPDVKINDKVV